MLTSLSHHTLLIFWLQLLVIFVVARLLGGGARKIGLPSVVGELSAGLVLGPTVFGRFWPDGFDVFLPSEHAEVQSAMLLAVTWFSAAFLLAVAGFETDLDLIKRLGNVAAYVTLGSVITPFIGGLAAGMLMPDTFYGTNEAGEVVSQWVFAAFIAVSVAVSALAVVAKILGDLKLLRRDVGQITIAVGMANDLIGWIVLGVIAGLAGSGSLSMVDLVKTTGGLALFLLAALTVGQRIVDSSLRLIRKKGRNTRGALSVTITAMLICGVITQAIGVEAVLGAFVAGVILTRSRYQQTESEHTIEDLTSVLFAPLFFSTAGLRVDLFTLSESDWKWGGALLGVALGLKFVGTFVGAIYGKLTVAEALVLGFGLNARGALEIIIATVGLSLGVFNDRAFTVIVMIPLVTSLIASVGLRVFGRNLEGSVSERERLVTERALSQNLLVKNDRTLLCALDSSNAIVASQILQFAWPEQVHTTLLRAEGSEITEPISNVLFGREVDEVTLGADPVHSIISQSRLGYGAIVAGAITGGHYESAVINQILQQSEIPVVIVRKATTAGRGRLPGVFAQALVPVVASSSSRAAQELAANLSSRLGTRLMLSHVIAGQPIPSSLVGLVRDTAVRHNKTAESVLSQAHGFASGMRANADTEIRFSDTPADEIVANAEEIDADLIVIGSQLRQLEGGRISLGPTVEHVIRHAPQTVVVVVMPDQRPELAESDS